MTNTLREGKERGEGELEGVKGPACNLYHRDKKSQGMPGGTYNGSIFLAADFGTLGRVFAY